MLKDKEGRPIAPPKYGGTDSYQLRDPPITKEQRLFLQKLKEERSENESHKHCMGTCFEDFTIHSDTISMWSQATYVSEISQLESRPARKALSTSSLKSVVDHPLNSTMISSGKHIQEFAEDTVDDMTDHNTVYNARCRQSVAEHAIDMSYERKQQIKRKIKRFNMAVCEADTEHQLVDLGTF